MTGRLLLIETFMRDGLFNGREIIEIGHKKPSAQAEGQLQIQWWQSKTMNIVIFQPSSPLYKYIKSNRNITPF